MKFLISIFFLFSCVQLPARVLHVGNHHPYKKIKDALAESKAGDTVLVHAGLYKEANIIIDKRIIFLGEGLPVLDGQKKFEVVSIKADSVTMSGFKVQHSGFATLDDPGGIKVYDSKYVTISNNVLDDNFFGIYCFPAEFILSIFYWEGPYSHNYFWRSSG